MKHVIDVADGDAQILTETGNGGLIGRGLLHDRPLAEHVGPTETPRFVVRNRKRGFTVERTDGGASDGAEGRSSGRGSGDRSDDDAPAAVDTGQVTPDGDHSAAALVTDARVLFAVGRSEGDRTRSVPLGDVVDARTETGLLNGTLVLDTIAGVQYRFPSRGDLAAVREFVDAAAGIWSRAERRLEAAEETLDRVEQAFEAGDVDVVLAAVGDVRETLDDAHEAAASLDAAAASVADRAEPYRDRLADYERRAHAERAEQARERGHTRWDDDAYETAADHFERAADSYAAALSVDADRPGDELIERRRANLAAERERLAASPLERAEQAVEVARGSDDPETAVAWWERALERYERLRSLDWGRDDPRFEGDREAVREQLATVAERLVEARCERARRALDTAEGAPPAAVAAACDRAEASLDAARSVARERVPDAMDTVEELDGRLADRRPDPSATDRDASADTGSETVVVPHAEDADASEAGDSPARPDADTGTADDGVDGDAAAEEADGDADAPSGDGWTLADDDTDDEWLSAQRVQTRVDPSDADTADTDADVAGDPTDSESALDSGADDTDDADGGHAVGPRDGGAATDTAGWTPAALSSFDSDGFAALVADCFRATGWAVESTGDDATAEGSAPGASASDPDLCVTAPGPADVRAGVRAVRAGDAASVDGGAVERFAASVERDGALDAAVLVAGGSLPVAARERAERAGVDVVAPDALVAALDDGGIEAPDEAGDTGPGA